MAKLPPINLPSKSIPQVEQYKDDDEFEDSLNQSISEQISEEIESNSAEDSIEKPKQEIDLEKKRRLFGLEAIDIESKTLSRFDENLDLLLSGENIAQHFKLDETNENNDDGRDVNDIVTETSKPQKISENVASNENQSDEKNMSGDRSVGDSNASKKNSISKSQTISKSHSHSNDDHKTDDENDVILINDQEISIHSLKKQQTENSADATGVTAQNTFSDLSDLLVEEVNSNIKEQKTSTEKENSIESEKETNRTSEGQVLTNGDSVTDKNLNEFLPSESTEDKQNKMKEIVNEAVSNIPIDDKLKSQRLDSFTTSDSDRPASSGITEVNKTLLKGLAIDRQFEDELNINLMHMQNKIAELQNIASGKYTLPMAYQLPLDTQSLPIKDDRDPPSGRESTSILTNSTEYRTFQEEYLRVSNCFA